MNLRSQLAPMLLAIALPACTSTESQPIERDELPVLKFEKYTLANGLDVILSEDHRLPLTLRYIVGADYDTISTQLGLTNGSLRGLLHRGLKMLRDRLPPEYAAEIG